MREPAAIGNFRILRQLGSGGMGTVYEAMNEAIERRVAIKVLRPEYARNPEFVARFFNEARAVNRIEHPSLVQISEYGQTVDGTAYIVMEYLRGETLTARLQRFHLRGERQPLPQTLQTAWQLAEALAAAHDKGIVHRDLKPDNVILVPDPVAPCGERAKLLDFGIAKLVQSNQDRTGTMVIMGTPSYMSPEQCRGAGEVNDRTDVYSLGTMLYQMVAGRLPFLGEGSGDLIGQHLHVEPQPLSTLAPGTPPLLVELVHRLLIKDKGVRPPMREALAELRRLLDGAATRLPSAIGLVSRTAGGSGNYASPVMTTISTLGRVSGERGREPRAKQLRLIGALAIVFLMAAGLVGGKLAWQKRRSGPAAAPGQEHSSDPVPRWNDQATISRPVGVTPLKTKPPASVMPSPPQPLAPADKVTQSADPAKEIVRQAVRQLPVSQPAVKVPPSTPVLPRPRSIELAEAPPNMPGKPLLDAKWTAEVPAQKPHDSEKAKSVRGVRAPTKPKGGPIEYEE